MFKTTLVTGLTVALLCTAGTSAGAATLSPKTVPATEPFEGSVVTENLDWPWDMVWGPDEQIWLTERQGKRITRVNPKTGEKHVLATLDDVHIGPQHEGVLGLALDPDLGKPGSRNHVYVSHTYMDGKTEHARIVRLTYDAKADKLVEPQVILAGLPAGTDHNGGRLRFGPDGKLYYSIGEQGHNQGVNYCKPIEAQRLPTAEEMQNNNRAGYRGKILRLNPDGSVPDDNPVLNGVKSHVYSYGHRNPQGLVFVDDLLFSSEHGPSTDDEINLIVAGGNYGWPHVAGFQDDLAYVYANYSAAPDCEQLKYNPNTIPESVPVQKESEWRADNFHTPLKTFYTVQNGYNFNDPRCKENPYLCWATIAPSSIDYYPANGPIEGWGNSLLVTSLKNGALYRVVMSGDMKEPQGDVAKYFHTGNRYRMVLVSPDGNDIYVATDNKGNALGMDGKPTTSMDNPGSILVFHYAPKTK